MINPVVRQTLFNACTYRHWRDQEVPDTLLRELYALMKLPPTADNSNPVRLRFVRSGETRARLVECLSDGNREPTRSAPIAGVIGTDLRFYDRLSELAPHTDARSWFVGDDKVICDTAFRKSSLQGAYLIIAARVIGLDCGPISGFDADRLDAPFFHGTATRVSFICNLGYGAVGTSPRTRTPSSVRGGVRHRMTGSSPVFILTSRSSRWH